MYTTYTGQLVRIRPFRDLTEWDSLACVGIEDPGEHWGPWFETLQENHPLFRDFGGMNEQEEYCMAIEEIASGRLVGEENIHPHRLGCWLGTHVLEGHRGKGYGVEAKLLAACMMFENFPLENVFAVTLARHSRAIRGLQLCGMQPIGGEAVSYFSAGTYANRVYYNLTRERWLEMDYRHSVRRS